MFFMSHLQHSCFTHTHSGCHTISLPSWIKLMKRAISVRLCFLTSNLSTQLDTHPEHSVRIHQCCQWQWLCQVQWQFFFTWILNNTDRIDHSPWNTLFLFPWLLLHLLLDFSASFHLLKWELQDSVLSILWIYSLLLKQSYPLCGLTYRATVNCTKGWYNSGVSLIYYKVDKSLPWKARLSILNLTFYLAKFKL